MVKENQTVSSDSSSVSDDVGMKATQVIKIIPEYSGRPHENIHEFLDAAEECFSLVKQSEQRILLSFIRTKLKSTAFKAIQYVTLNDWNQLKEHLQQRFGVGDTIRFIEKEFTMLNQKPHESVAEYGERTCTLAAKITEYNIREKKYDADMFQRIMEDRILVQFVTGLREPVRFQVKAYKCDDYREALAVAVNLEKEAQANRDFDGRHFLKKLGLRDQGSYGDKPKCHKCHKYGHKMADCFFNKEKPRYQEKARVNVVTCYYCNRSGHIARDCRSKAYDARNNNRRINGRQEGSDHIPSGSGNESRLPLASRTGRPANSFK